MLKYILAGIAAFTAGALAKSGHWYRSLDSQTKKKYGGFLHATRHYYRLQSGPLGETLLEHDGQEYAASGLRCHKCDHMSPHLISSNPAVVQMAQSKPKSWIDRRPETRAWIDEANQEGSSRC